MQRVPSAAGEQQLKSLIQAHVVSLIQSSYALGVPYVCLGVPWRDHCCRNEPYFTTGSVSPPCAAGCTVQSLPLW